MAYADSLRQQYATFTTAADLIDGVLSASTVFSAFTLASTTSAVGYIHQYSADTAGGFLSFRKSRGATFNTNTIVASGDVIGNIVFQGANGTSYTDGARIRALVSATPGASNDMPTDLIFETVPDGSGTLTERVRIKNSGNVGINIDDPNAKLAIKGTTGTTSSSTYPGTVQINEKGITSPGFTGGLEFCGSDTGAGYGSKLLGYDDGSLEVLVRASSATWTAAGRWDNAGRWLIGGTNTNPVGNNVAGIIFDPGSSSVGISRMGNVPFFINRGTNDGNLIEFYQAGALEGAISVAGATVTYGPFVGYHWSQLSDGTAPALEVGTVMESINELCAWDGESEQRLPKAKVSDTIASPAVYGVFMRWDTDWVATNDMAIASVGAYFCRVAAGTVLAIGDLLESAGNGYAQKQADDIIRTRTIGKVTALTQSHIAADGSFCIPTVLYCG